MFQAAVPWRAPVVATDMGLKFDIKMKSSKVTLPKPFPFSAVT